MPLEIKFGKKIRVFETGTVIQYKQENLTFKLTGIKDKKNSIIIEIRFLVNIEEKETKMYFENGGINHLIMNLVNFNNKVGHGNTEPIIIGTLDNYELFLTYRVTSGTAEFSKTIEYTFYLGEEVTNA